MSTPHAHSHEPTPREDLRLPSSDALVRLALETVLDGFAIYGVVRDGDGRVVDLLCEYMNRAGAESAGLPVAEVLGRRVTELIPPEHHAMALGLAAGLVASRESFEVAGLEVGRDAAGEARRWDVRVAPWQDGFVATWREVTAQLRETSVVRRSHERLEALRHATEAIADTRGVGAALRELLAQATHVFEAARGAVALVRADGRGLDVVRTSADGPVEACVLPGADPLWDAVRAAEPVFSSHSAGLALVSRGRVLGALVLDFDAPRAFDATETALLAALARAAAVALDNARLLQDLEASEKRAREIADGLPHVVWLTDARLALQHCNERWVQFTGHRQDELDAGGWRRVVHPDDRAAAVARLRDARRGGVPAALECRLRRHDGEWRWFLLSMQPLYGAQGQLTGWLGTGVDVDDRKEAEQLRRQLIGIVGHDLRTPLSAVIANIDMLLRKGPDAGARPSLDRARRSAKRMQNIIEGLLDFTLAESAGGIPLRRASCDLAEISKAVLDEVAQVHPTRALVFDAPAPVTGAWDRDRLAQVVQNLVGNAIFHGAEERPVAVRVAVEGASAVLTVENGGKPIPPDMLGRIFEPFQRGSERQGLGLGLFIVRSIVRAHGGSIEVSSSAEEGTRVSVRLPIA